MTILPFHLWPAQQKLLDRFQSHRQHIILKARQLGISWLVCAYALWLCLFQPGRTVIVFSKGQLEADELLRRILVMYERLPDWMRATNPLVKQNTGELRFQNGSAVLSLPATKNAGRTFTASLVIIDEFAFLAWPQELYTAIKPTIDDGGQLIVLSTANGESGLFYDLWQAAVKGESTLLPSFLSWRARPGRTEAWRASVASDIKLNTLVDQEYPALPDDAFCNTGSDRFLPSIVLWDACHEDLPPLDRRTRLVLGVDGAVGRSTGPSDYFALVAVSRHPDPNRRDDQAVRFVKAWQARAGQMLDGTAIEYFIRWFCTTYACVEVALDPNRLEFMQQRLSKPGQYCPDLRCDHTSCKNLIMGHAINCRAFSQQGDRVLADGALLDRIGARGISWTKKDSEWEILRAHLDNADRRAEQGSTNEQRRIRIVKRSESLKVDGCISLSQASYRASKLGI